MTRYLPAFSLVMLAIYPAYLLVAVMIDSVIGEKLFLSEILFTSRYSVARTVASDWLYALPYAFVTSFLLTFASTRFSHRLVPSLFCGILLGLVLGVLAGLVTEPFVGISLGIALVIVSPLLCVRYGGT